MTKTVILEFDLYGTHPDHTPGLEQLAQEDGEYYTRWRPHHDPNSNHPWIPVTRAHAHKLIAAKRLLSHTGERP